MADTAQNDTSTTTAKKATPRKTAARNPAAKKTAAGKTTTAQATAAVKAPATRGPAKKTAAPRAPGRKAAPVRPVDNRTRPAAEASATDADTEQLNPIQRLIRWRVGAAMEPQDPSQTVLKLQQPLVDLLSKYYFRLEVEGWDRVPEENCLVIGVHSGGALTMDAWTLVSAWHDHFGGKRHLHGTAHDVLMASPGLGDYFRAVGVIAANRKSVGAALESGKDVAIWPGGEVDAMRSWAKRDIATLGGRTGFVKQAIRSGVPILPVATVGGHDTVFVLNEGKWLANALDKVLGLKKTLRGSNLPIIAGFPFPLAVEILPAHVPLPAKIRTEMLDPIEVDTDPARVEDEAYVQKIYDQVQASIQAGMDRLAAKRKLPILG